MDLSLVIHKLKQYKLYEYNAKFPIIFAEAFDPDGACYKAYYGLMSIILRQDGSKETSELLKELMLDITIRKIRVPE